MKKLCLIPELSGIGGMVSFQGKLRAGLQRLGIETTFDVDSLDFDALLVIGGTRHLSSLMKVKRSGIPVIQRLDGMNWAHRVTPTGFRHYIRAEYGNLLLAFIRRQNADKIIYQSNFSKSWWERERGLTRIPNDVVYNGVDTREYSPEGDHNRSDDRFTVLLVEGSLMGGYHHGLDTVVAMTDRLSKRSPKPIEIVVAGRISPELQTHYSSSSPVDINWLGVVPGEKIPALDRSAHLLFSADINAACPNSVIEALACGLPVLSYDTGALKELVDPSSGRIVPYGGDPWKLDKPDIPSLTEGALDILNNQAGFREAARKRAMSLFTLDDMVNKYVESIKEMID